MVIIVILVWRWTGYIMIYFLAGLQNIPRELYEAALARRRRHLVALETSPCRCCGR